jgi:hypothetical protein
MATIYQSPQALPARPAPIGDSAQVISDRGVFNLANLSATLGSGDIFELVKLPAEHVLVDAILDCSQLDTAGTPTVTVTVSAMNPGLTDLSSTLTVISASNIGQTGGMARMNVVGLLEGGPVAPGSNQSDLLIAAKLTAAVATPVVTGTIALTLLYRPERFGV